MEIHHAGVVAAGVALDHRAIAPQALAPVRPIDAGDTTTTDATSSPRRDLELVITLPEESFPIPDAETIATMQLTAGIRGEPT